MRKGLQLTLMTVAIALISVQAMANAPVIQNIPSPIVGNAEPVTDGGTFVFIDAMDLNTLAIDDSTPATQLLWSYYEKAKPTDASAFYLINGVMPIDPKVTDPTSPTTSQLINRTIGKGPNNTKLEWNPDGQANTITIRNQSLSPLGSGSTPDQGWQDGLISAEQQSVTFFCSDGTSYSFKTVQFYSTANDYDKLSGNLWTNLKNEAPKPNGTWKAEGWSAGVTSSTWAGGTTGLCIISPKVGDYVAEFASPAPYFSISKNSVYRIKMQMNSSQSTHGFTPLWDLVLENTNPAGTFGKMAYAMDTVFYDDARAGGNNTVINTQNGDWKTIYWTPGGVQTDQWNTKAFTTAYDGGKRDPRLRFRILDVSAAGEGDTKFGAICIQQITVDQVPLSRVRVLSNVVSIANGGLKAANANGTGNVEVTSLVDASNKRITVTYANGAVTIKPNSLVVANSYNGTASSAQDFELTEIHPAAKPGTDDLTNWPLTWAASTTDPYLYRMQVGMSAPTPTDAASPWDAIYLSIYSRTYEIIEDTYVTSRDLLASPAYAFDKNGNIVPQIFTMFFQAGKGSLAPLASNARLKWVVRFANVPPVRFPDPSNIASIKNTGAVTVHSIQVDKVDFNLH